MAETTMSGRRGDLFENVHADRTAIILGALIILAGVLALIAGFTTTATVVMVVGLVFIGAGLARIAAALKQTGEHRGHVARGVAVGVLYVVTGGIVLANPGATIMTVTLALGMLFLAGGIVRIVAAAVERPPAWGWDVASGVVSTILGLIVFATWPISSAWLIGTLVAVELISTGIAVMAAGFFVRSVRRDIEAGWEERTERREAEREIPPLH